MADTSTAQEFTVRFDGERFVPEETVDLPIGVPFKVRLVESEEERKTRMKAAIRSLGELGKGAGWLDESALEDRGTYYDDDHRAGLD